MKSLGGRVMGTRTHLHTRNRLTLLLLFLMPTKQARAELLRRMQQEQQTHQALLRRQHRIES